MIAKEGGVGVYRSNFIKLEQPSMLFVRTTSVLLRSVQGTLFMKRVNKHKRKRSNPFTTNTLPARSSLSNA